MLTIFRNCCNMSKNLRFYKIKQKEIIASDRQLESHSCVLKQHNNPSKWTLIIRAKPNANISKIVSINQEYIGVNVSAVPSQGAANQQLICYLSNVLQVSAESLQIKRGENYKSKIIVLTAGSLSQKIILDRLRADL